MTSRRTFLSTSLPILISAAVSAPANAYSAARLYRPSARDLGVLHREMARVRRMYNDADIAGLVKKARHLRIFDKGFEKAEAIEPLAKFRKENGRILAEVADENSLTYPEWPKIIFVTSMETMSAEDAFSWGYMEAPVGGHHTAQFGLTLYVDRETAKFTSEWDELSIQWARP